MTVSWNFTLNKINKKNNIYIYIYIYIYIFVNVCHHGRRELRWLAFMIMHLKVIAAIIFSLFKVYQN